LGQFQWACKAEGEKHQRFTADLHESSKKAQAGKPVVHFGVISRYNPRMMLEEYQPIMDYLSENTSYHFALVLGKTYEDEVQSLCEGKVQIASLGGMTYLQAHKKCAAVPIVQPLNKNREPFYRSVIVVRKDSPFQKLSDLRGHSFAFAAIHSTSGNIAPRYYLLQAGFSLEDLSHHQNFRHHDSVVKAVLSGQFDAGAVKDIVAVRYLEGLRILHRSERIPSVPFVVRPDCDSDLVNSVKSALLKINPDDAHQASLLAEWSEEFRYGFVPASDVDYEVVRRLIRKIPEQCDTACHPGVTL
ncbi:phosphate/phosphite/phosphonate ABC transporter substrate-binding protein, partial [candidate division KSB1 bacterium]|nr:phosphate/phosphite/phosphonate ABC transporter substrate-binding protein [candidate division KSB1 bacterium]NIR69337.1 phosphate/phosphite/phosphonate ABC transporter substrate-binding protein [candidate division KSB1 bacterium]NIS24155.1 phosphate/phosphite/phosphonate ABC transporter substrate-binding protein [candidate division KSB1 bacterium]NIT71070.1 phosphate/phosphite/phosphonate ABC transporter substrate-binding protein [candidate division KSB1 bacterium]NIU24774.1 phosphate/phosph